MNAEETFTFAVETTAEIEVLRHAVAFLMAQALVPMSREGRATVLTTFEETVSDMAPDPDPAHPGATRFFEAVADAMPARTVRFADTVRRTLEGWPPPPSH